MTTVYPLYSGPDGAVSIAGSQNVAVSAAYAVSPNDYIITATGAGSFTITLLKAAPYKTKNVIIKCLTTASITVNAAAGELIDSAASRTLINGEILDIISDGTKWIDTVGSTISGAKIVDGTITASKLSTDSVTADKIAANAVGNSELATDSVTADKIATGAVSTSEINTNAQPTVNTIYTSNWFRSQGQSGWYSESYGGGIYMLDSTWVRTYGSKNFYCNAEIRADGILRAGYGETRIDPSSWDKIILCRDGYNTSSGYFYYNAGNSYGVISDRRTKNSIQTLPQTDAVNFILNIKPVTFKMNGSDLLTCGFIAQEILNAAQNDAQKNITPNHETYNENDKDCPLMGVSDHALTPNIVSAVQFLHKQNQEQQQQIQTLEERIKKLEEIINKGA